jgi:NADP-reducing hydrogenase subunit HndA
MDNKCRDCLGLKVNEKAIKAVEKYRRKPGAVMMALHEIQDECGYISIDNQKYLSNELNVPLSEIYGIITFYNRFSLEPKGKYNIQVCTGTACHVKGSEKILNEFKRILKIDIGGITEDGKFSLEDVRCLGACGLAPAIVVNKEVYGKMTVKKVSEVIQKYIDAK